jgi:hypothetical protein
MLALLIAVDAAKGNVEIEASAGIIIYLNELTLYPA